jgi:hypothetical protein
MSMRDISIQFQALQFSFLLLKKIQIDPCCCLVNQNQLAGFDLNPDQGNKLGNVTLSQHYAAKLCLCCLKQWL